MSTEEYYALSLLQVEISLALAEVLRRLHVLFVSMRVLFSISYLSLLGETDQTPPAQSSFSLLSSLTFPISGMVFSRLIYFVLRSKLRISQASTFVLTL